MTETNSDGLDLLVEFDPEEDVLYISLGVEVCGHTDLRPDGLLLRRIAAEGCPSGVTALDFRGNWLHRRAELYSAVADCLNVPVAELTSIAEVAIAAHEAPSVRIEADQQKPFPLASPS